VHQLNLLRQLYSEIGESIGRFQQLSGISCLFGCGDCCTRFEPYISILEGLLIAESLRQDQARCYAFYHFPRSKSDLLCPFYDPYTPLHCSIHPIRPLICRLFAFSARRAASAIEYLPCQLIARHMSARVAAAQLFVRQGVSLPVYADIHPRLRAIDFLLATDLHPLTDSVELALRHWDEMEHGQYPQVDSRDDRFAIPFSCIVRKHLTYANKSQ
jgi:Fe-S-cluster containining protein